MEYNLNGNIVDTGSDPYLTLNGDILNFGIGGPASYTYDPSVSTGMLADVKEGNRINVGRSATITAREFAFYVGGDDNIFHIDGTINVGGPGGTAVEIWSNNNQVYFGKNAKIYYGDGGAAVDTNMTSGNKIINEGYMEFVGKFADDANAAVILDGPGDGLSGGHLFENYGVIRAHTDVFQIHTGGGNLVRNFGDMFTDDGAVGFVVQPPDFGVQTGNRVENYGRMVNTGNQLMDPESGTPWGAFRSLSLDQDELYNDTNALIDGPGVWLGEENDVVVNKGKIDTIYVRNPFESDPSLKIAFSVLMENGDDSYSSEGNDPMSGGQTRYHGDVASTDYLRAFVDGGNGNDTLIGGGRNDNFLGGDGNDILVGGRGDDVLSGGTGTNVLTGGEGFDVFVLKEALRSGTHTTITDFNPAYDKFVVDAEIHKAVYGTTDVLKAGQFHIGKHATTTDQRFIFDQDTGELKYDADGRLPFNRETVIAHLEGPASVLSKITEKNFTVNADYFYF